MASLATTTVFNEESTRRGTGRYCSAVSDAIVVVGDIKRMERESELRMDELGDLDRGRSPRAKYPSSTSAPSGSAITTILVLCDYCRRKDSVSYV
jgi:hypothetical protein